MKKLKLETIKIKLRRKYMKLTAKIRSKKIRNDNFTIISDNCWGGFIYQSYNKKYLTPTIGCFFMPDDYIKFVSNLKKYIDNDNLYFISAKESKWYEIIKDRVSFGKYPIGVIDDIEIHFLHYSSDECAKEKWNKRKKRINYNNILYKFSEMNGCTEKQIIEFQKLNLKNKICFVSQNLKDFSNEYTIVVNRKKQNVKASEEPFGNSKLININEVINHL